MVKPLTIEEQLKNIEFKPDSMLIVEFVTSKYDAAWEKNEKDEIVQVYEDLELGKDTGAALRSAFEQFQIDDAGEEGIYTINEDPTKE